MIFRKKSSVDFTNEIKGGNGSNVFKNVLISFLEKIGLVSIRCELETEMSIDISADEMQVLFKREDENFENLERDMEKLSKVVDRFVEKSIDTAVKSVKRVVKEYHGIQEFWDLTEEEAYRKRERKERHEKIVRSEEDQDEKTILGFHDSDI